VTLLWLVDAEDLAAGIWIQHPVLRGGVFHPPFSEDVLAVGRRALRHCAEVGRLSHRLRCVRIEEPILQKIGVEGKPEQAPLVVKRGPDTELDETAAQVGEKLFGSFSAEIDSPDLAGLVTNKQGIAVARCCRMGYR